MYHKYLQFLIKKVQEAPQNDEENSSLNDKEPKKKDILLGYFKLENFFEKYHYLTKHNKNPPVIRRLNTNPELSLDDDEEEEKRLLDQTTSKKITKRQIMAEMAENKLKELKIKKKNEKLRVLEENRRLEKIKNSEKMRNLFENSNRMKELTENAKKIEKNKKYLKSAFSNQEIEEFDTKDIKSMLSIDEDINSNKKSLATLFCSEKMKNRLTKKKTKNEKICFNLCVERDAEEEERNSKCLIY